MYFCDLTLSTPAENLACDEYLLEACETGLLAEALRVWTPMQYFVVLGYSDKISTEVNLDYCQIREIPVLRRSTGGGTVLQGPGVLNYSLILRCDSSPELATISGTNSFVMKRHCDLLTRLTKSKVEVKGHTDLAIEGRKFSGNAQRRRKHSLIFHGSFLLGLDIQEITRALSMPSRQPDYRSARSHADFLTNLNLDPNLLKRELAKAWNAWEQLAPVSESQIYSLATSKYATDEWTKKF